MNTHCLSSGRAAMSRSIRGLLLLSLLCALIGPAFAECPAIRIHVGESEGDQMGYSVAAAGDVNNDGIDDYVAGALLWGPNSGKVYVFSGLTGDTLHTFTATGNPEQFGIAVAGAGDVNNDDFDDILVGAPRYGSFLDSGRAYVYSGQDGGILRTIQGHEGSLLGSAVAGLGDLNGDGFDDIAVTQFFSSGGRSRVIFVSGQTGARMDSVLSPSFLDFSFGAAIANGGDVNGDNINDLVVSFLELQQVYVYSGANRSLIHTIDGSAFGSVFGQSVAAAGDVDNDGFDDVIVGDPSDGRVYVYSGQDGTQIIQLTGTVDAFGRAVGGIGDLDGDNLDDIVVGIQDDAFPSNGEVQVYGSSDWTVIRSITGSDVEGLGFSLACDLDINSDGRRDMIIGAPFFEDFDPQLVGRVRVYTCPDSDGDFTRDDADNCPEDADLAFADADQDSIGDACDPFPDCPPAPLYNLGGQVFAAGDVNNDGYDDLIIAEPLNDVGGTDAGRVRIRSGLDTTLLHEFLGEAAGDQLGFSVSAMGDINGDDHDDIVVGAPGNDAAGSSAGRAYVFSGQDGTALYTKTGLAAGDRLGQSVSGSGDVNHDGVSDFAVGAPDGGSGGPGVGRVYVYSGVDGATLHTIDGSPSGGIFSGGYGSSVTLCGDVDLDNFDDFVVGAPGHDTLVGEYWGKAVVYSGQTGVVIHEWIGNSPNGGFGEYVASAGDVNNDGRADVLVGTSQDDAAGDFAGRAVVFSGLTGEVLHEFFGIRDNFAPVYVTPIAGVGDLDGDGFDDFALGNIVYSGQTGERMHGLFQPLVGAGVRAVGDLDNDGAPELARAGVVYSFADPDADGVPSMCDNCPNAFNPGQEDADLDEIGDVCDALLVTTLGDGGPGSLREAITNANLVAGPSLITFQSGGTITLATPLPPLTDDGTTIDGSNPGGRSNGVPMVILDGSALGVGNGLEIASSGNTISGLKITGFPGDGIVVTGAGVSGNSIAGCYLYDNGGLAIDLGDDGPTVNDAGDADTGPNTLVNYPTIDTVFLIATDTFYIAGIAPPSSFVQLYLADLYLGADTIGDASGHGEGWLILDTVTADAGGYFACDSVPVRDFSLVSAIATDPGGNTSEFSPNRQVIPDSLIFTAYSPVTIIVIEPDSSDSIGTAFNTIGSTAAYDAVTDWGIGPNGVEGEPDDRVIITNVQGGTYTIKVRANPGATGDGYFLGIRVDGTNEVYAGVSGSLSPLPVENPLPAEGTEAVFAYKVTATPRGDLDGNRLLDAVDLALLIDVVFFAGTEPNPPALGDINCDSVSDAVDLAILIDHVFFAGDAPCH